MSAISPDDSGSEEPKDLCSPRSPTVSRLQGFRGKDHNRSPHSRKPKTAEASRSVVAEHLIVNVSSQNTSIQTPSPESLIDTTSVIPSPSRIVVRLPNLAAKEGIVSRTVETAGASSKQSADTPLPYTKGHSSDVQKAFHASHDISSTFDQRCLSSKQLIYLKIKAQSYSKEFLVFKGDSLILQQELLAHLAKIPNLAASGAFAPELLQFALSRHSKMNGHKLKGNYFTAGFTLLTNSLAIDIPQLILEAQAEQKNACFLFQLTAVTASGPKPTKAKITFARQLDTLADIFQLEFQVRIPLVIANTPAKDFALLVSEILFPPESVKETAPYTTFLQKSDLLTEVEKIESFCLPLKHTHTEHGIIVNKLLTGFFPLNLEDDDHRDVAICQRLLFAAMYGLDLRPRHRERYLFFLPILNDRQQLDRTPAIFKRLASAIQESFAQTGLSKLTTKRSDASSTSESETEELYLTRYNSRAQVLKLLPPVTRSNSSLNLEFPTLTGSASDFMPILMRPPTVCKSFLEGKCAKGSKCELIHEIYSTSNSEKSQERRLNARSPIAAQVSRPTALISQSFAQQRAQSGIDIQAQNHTHSFIDQSKVTHFSKVQTKEERPHQHQHPYDGTVLYDSTRAKAFPSIDQLKFATIQTVAPDGNCLWSSFLQATSKLQLQLIPNSTPMQLRLMIMHFIKSNLDIPCLALIALPEAPLSLTSPAEVLASQMSKRLILVNNKRTPCPCTRQQISEKGHACNGIPFGDIQTLNGTNLFYTNFDEYFDGMCCNGSFSEDLEIMALSSLFKINIAVYVPARDHQAPVVTHFFQPNAKGLALLINHNGRGHYDWLSFSDLENEVIFSKQQHQQQQHKQQQQHHQTLIEEQDATLPHKDDGRMPITLWIESKIISLQMNFVATRQSAKFPFSWPLLKNSKYASVIQPLEAQLSAIISRPAEIATTTTDSSTDPWTESMDHTNFLKIADGTLAVVSSTLFLEADVENLSIRSLYLLSRLFELLYGFLEHHGNVLNLYPADNLLGFRMALMKLKDTLALLRDFAANITIHAVYRDSFLSHNTIIIEYLEALTEIVELCFTIAESVVRSESPRTAPKNSPFSDEDFPASGSSSPKQSYSAISSQSQQDYASQFLIICDDLSKKAEKASFLAKDRLRTVCPENAVIAKAQIRALASDIAKFKVFCEDHKSRLDASSQKPNIVKASAAVQQLTLNIIRSLNTISEIETSITTAPPLPSTPATKKTAKRALTSAKPLLSPRELAQQRTIESFFTQVHSLAEKLITNPSNSDDGFAFQVAQDPHEDAIRLLERAHHSETKLHELILEERARKGSTASRFLAEALQTDDLTSSQGSNDSMSRHASDDSFLRSQGSAFQEERHPRHALARTNIQEALIEDKSPQIIAMAHVQDLPAGYCEKGHSIRYRPTIRKGKQINCSCCKKDFSDNSNLFSCHCGTYFACSSCLQYRKTYPAPPKCPNLSCTDSCTMRHKPVITRCYQGQHVIAANEQMWMCSNVKCKSIICRTCAQSFPAPNISVPPRPCSPPTQAVIDGLSAPMRSNDGQ
jgi:hypothetical protein